MKRIPPGLKITQVGVVVKDLWKTMKAYHEMFGWGPWSVYEMKAPLLHDVRLRGKRVTMTDLGAEVHVDPVDFELIQPTSGPSLQREFLEQRGEGLHHVAVATPSEDIDGLLTRLKRQGIEVIMSGKVGKEVEFYYFDTEPVLKIATETASVHSIALKPKWVYP